MKNNIELERLYKKWCNNAKSSESTESKIAFYAGYYAAFDRIMDLVRMMNILAESNSLKNKNEMK